MTTLLLVRHGRTAANAAAVLAGWTPGVGLDEQGQQQAAALADRLRPVPLAAVVSSPLDRCMETAAAIAAGRAGDQTDDQAAAVETDQRLGEAHYGDWTGKELKKLVKDPLWPVVQQHPSAAVFPGDEGEGLAHTQARAVAAVRDWNARLGQEATWLACSHADVIKAVVADALGLHLDLFQRIVVDPCSLTVIRYTATRPFVVRLNDVGGAVTDLLPPKRRRRRRAARSAAAGDAIVGGGAGGAG
ncbi:MAG: MSMEG_4193 family putative phosphomutase [Pseudonocardiales bacterium]